jgi:CubicO group peptidase (beta-lactamase class C family)
VNSITNRLAALLVLVAAATASAAPAGASTEHPNVGNLTASLASDENEWLAAYGVPGAAVAVIQNGEVTSASGYGEAVTGEAPMTPDTVIQVASISKSVTAWGVMALVEHGVIDLDVPVDRYLTSWQLPDSSFDNDGVTVRRLLSHSAGLNSIDYFPLPPGQPLPSLVESLEGNNGGGQSLRVTMEPGAQYSYSNGGYSLLQLVVEDVTGEPFAEYMQRTVLDPLGMINSTYDPASVTGPRAFGYYATGEQVPRYELTEQAAAGLYSTANDVARFVAAAMPGPDGAVPGRGVISVAGADLLQARTELPGGTVLSLGYDTETLADGSATIGHSGRNVGWTTQFTVLPELSEGIVVLTNSYGGDGIIGLNLRSWSQWLGVGQPMAAQMADVDLETLRTILLGISALVFVLLAIWGIRFVLQARAGRRRPFWADGRRRWTRVVGMVVAVAVAITWIRSPERMTDHALLPTEVTTVTLALLLACVAAVVAMLFRVTRRTSVAS